jgi:hypothetical protein
MARPPRVIILLPRVVVDVEGGARCEQVVASDVPGALKALITARPGLGLHLLDEQGALRRHVRIAVDDRIVADVSGLELRDGDRITVLHSVSGG